MSCTGQILGCSLTVTVQNYNYWTVTLTSLAAHEVRDAVPELLEHGLAPVARGARLTAKAEETTKRIRTGGAREVRLEGIGLLLHRHDSAILRSCAALGLDAALGRASLDRSTRRQRHVGLCDHSS